MTPPTSHPPPTPPSPPPPWLPTPSLLFSFFLIITERSRNQKGRWIPSAFQMNPIIEMIGASLIQLNGGLSVAGVAVVEVSPSPRRPPPTSTHLHPPPPTFAYLGLPPPTSAHLLPSQRRKKKTLPADNSIGADFHIRSSFHLQNPSVLEFQATLKPLSTINQSNPLRIESGHY